MTTRTQTWVDFTREADIAPLVATETYIVEDGLIRNVTWTPTVKMIAKLEVLMAASDTMPATGGESFPAYLLMLVVGGLLLIIGLGMRQPYCFRGHQG